MSTSTSYSYFLETILIDYANGETFAISRPIGAGYFGTLSDTATINKSEEEWRKVRAKKNKGGMRMEYRKRIQNRVTFPRIFNTRITNSDP